jgi:uncharacterized protein (DUF2062 family)
MKDGIWRRKIVGPLVGLLTQGVSCEKIAWSLTLGIVIGVFPVLGSTTVLCALAAAILRLNLPAIQLVNYLVYPLQFALLVPFIRLGETLFAAQPLRLSLPEMLAMSRANLPHAISSLWVTALQGASAWLLLSPAMVAVLYFPLLWAIRGLTPALARSSQC